MAASPRFAWPLFGVRWCVCLHHVVHVLRRHHAFKWEKIVCTPSDVQSCVLARRAVARRAVARRAVALRCCTTCRCTTCRCTTCRCTTCRCTTCRAVLRRARRHFCAPARVVLVCGSANRYTEATDAVSGPGGALPGPLTKRTDLLVPWRRLGLTP